METISFPTGGHSKIALQISGNLKVRGWDQAEIQAEVTSKDILKFSEDAGLLTVRSWGNTQLQIPSEADLEVNAVEGNANLAMLPGTIQISKVGGNLKLRQVGRVEIEKIYGNAGIRDVEGDINLGEVYGNLTVSRVAGRVSSQKAIKGNMVLSWVQGASAKAMGNTTLSVQAVDAEEYEIEASGNIHCYLAPGTNATIQARSSSMGIRIDLPERSERLRETEHKFQVGEGGATITLNARGYVHIALREPEDYSEESEYPEDLEEIDAISDEINHLIERQMEALEEQINEKLSHLDMGETPDLTTDIDEIVDQARQYSTLAALEAQSQAEAAAQKAQEKLAMKLKNAKMQAAAEKKSRSAAESSKRRWPGFGPAATGRGKSAEVSEEERLMVLKMVEENTISLEEAEELLAALEGREG